MLPLHYILYNIETITPDCFAGIIHYFPKAVLILLKWFFCGTFLKITTKIICGNFHQQQSEYQKNLLKKKFFILSFLTVKIKFSDQKLK
jgi:hypothetical protein